MNGIPSFVEEDAEYVSAFGLQWITYSKTQLDSFTGLSITRDRIRRMLGPLYDLLNDKIILEAGCGAGRFTEILLESNCLITAVDLSVAVAANQDNNGKHENLRLARASITSLPFEPGQFDIVFCPGVVQHTPNPSETIQSLYSQIKPGGWLVFDQYRHNVSSWLKVAWILRLILKRLTPARGLRATDWLVNKWLPIHRKVAGNKILEILLFRVSPITAHFTGYPDMSDKDQVAWARLNTHDNLTDWHKHYTTVRRMRKIVNSLGAINQTYRVMPYTLEVRCQRPTGDEKPGALPQLQVIRNTGRNVQSG
ncbi:unannotated protein [freshwater metagenome]|uniref:Unannotated protein n=1 Tax=freshwater metagenome TaxID=449393 RepID=A0A6J7AJZ2_9ZZZZ